MRPRHLLRLAALGAVGWALARRRYLYWGATEDEIRRPLPGDELLPDTDLVATRAISIRAPRQAVWPWIAQLGQGRGGFYSYDSLENLVGCDMRSAETVMPEWQSVALGDEVRLHPEVALEVAAVESDRALVLRGGVPMGDTPAPYDFTWSFVVTEEGGTGSRLLVRERYAYSRWWTPLLVEPVELVSFVMSQKMMRGIRDRAERTAG
jgi:hypothetical protein